MICIRLYKDNQSFVDNYTYFVLENVYKNIKYVKHLYLIHMT